MESITNATEAKALCLPTSEVGSQAASGGEFESILKDTAREVSMDAIFEEAAARYELPVSLLRAVARVESNFNPNAVSHAGAIGVMQLMPKTAQGLGVENPYDAWQNIMGGAKYLRQNLDRFQDLGLALSAYNAGPGAVQKAGGMPSYTQNYVQKVMGYMGDTSLLANRSVSYASSNNNYTQQAGLSALSGLLGGSSVAGSSLLNGLMGSNSSYILLNSLLNSASSDQEYNENGMDKESFTNLLQIFRIQMMMSAGTQIGTMEI